MSRQFASAAACAFAFACSAPLQATSPTQPQGDTRVQLEACSKWTERDGSFGFTNECREPVALLFIDLSGGRRFDRVIQPSERFDTGVDEKTINASGWLFTVCPAGYAPSLPFTAENQIPIARGQYKCVRK